MIPLGVAGAFIEEGKEAMKMPKLPPPPRMRNYLLKFEDQAGRNAWLTVYASSIDEAFALAKGVEARISWKFQHDATEL